LKPTAITKFFLKLRRKDEAFLFKLFQSANVHNAISADGNILVNLLIFTMMATVKRKLARIILWQAICKKERKTKL
jgi:hypothetical protein